MNSEIGCKIILKFLAILGYKHKKRCKFQRRRTKKNTRRLKKQRVDTEVIDERISRRKMKIEMVGEQVNQSEQTSTQKKLQLENLRDLIDMRLRFF